MLELFCDINQGFDYIKTVNLDKSIKSDIGDISSINVDYKNKNIYLLSDSNPAYFIRIRNQINEIINKDKKNLFINAEKNYLNDKMGIFNNKYDTENFFLDSHYMYIISEIESYKSNSVILKYDLIKNNLIDLKLIKDLDSNYYAITEFDNDKLIIFSKSSNTNLINDISYLKYQVFTKDLDYIKTGFIEASGRLNDFKNFNESNFFISLVEKRDSYHLGFYSFKDFKNNLPIIPQKLKINLPIDYSQNPSLQGYTIIPNANKDKYTFLFVNDNNKKRFFSEKKFFNNIIRYFKFYISKLFKRVKPSQILIYESKKNISCIN